jgi:aquaporin Z
MPNYSLPAKLLAEFVGTFFLIAAGVGVFVSTNGSPDLLAVAFAHGLAIAVAVSGVGHVSGGHFNPAVSTALAAFGKIPVVDAVLYIVAQLAGAYAASLVLWQGFDVKASALAGSVPRLADGLGAGQGFLLELVATFFLIWTIAAVAVDYDGAFQKVAGLPIGLSITVGILMIGPATGAALNPARWFGPALLTTSWDDAWVWILGPIVGGLLAVGMYLYIVRPRLANVAVDSVEPA